MSYNRSRRLFIGGTVAASAIGASGISHLVSAQSVSASASPGPSPKALDAIAKASAEGGAYYAYPAAMTLLDMIAERYGITRKHISLSAGSSPILSYAARKNSGPGPFLGHHV